MIEFAIVLLFKRIIGFKKHTAISDNDTRLTRRHTNSLTIPCPYRKQTGEDTGSNQDLENDRIAKLLQKRYSITDLIDFVAFFVFFICYTLYICVYMVCNI